MRTAVLLLLSALFFQSCSSEDGYRLEEYTGYAQGSTYQIKVVSDSGDDLGPEFERIFEEIDSSMNTYLDYSMITRINSTYDWVTVDTHFVKVLDRSVEIAEETKAAFDPTVGPLVRLWGFDFDEIRQDVTDSMVRDAKNKTGYEKIERDGNRVRLPEGSSLDFNAIAQGYTVDVIADYLDKRNATGYMVEVGGEIRTKGSKPDGGAWTIGVDKPSETIDPDDRFQFILELDEVALATSGNYRKFWVDEKTGVKYSHTIEPRTGRPAMNRLLSVSITAPTAMDADAYATTCMVIGRQQCLELVNRKEELEAYLVFSGDEGQWETVITQGFEQRLIDRD